ncbi:hypothetical protein BC829DRAFT_437351 [Chytridium lagenaria]|nr:hypothetical protein BC829DRAFT_437351 [Chytridium lagenaria]
MWKRMQKNKEMHRESEMVDTEKREKERMLLQREDAEKRVKEIETIRRLGGDDSRSAMLAGASRPIDETIIVPEYIEAVTRVLHSDKTLTPTPDDFAYPDGFTLWQKVIGGPLQQVIADLLIEHHISGPARRALEVSQATKKENSSETKVSIFFKVVEARGLVAKEGRTYDAICKIEHGALHLDHSVSMSSSKKLGVDTFQTNAVQGSTSIVWNQHMKIDVKNIMDRIAVTVWDQRTEEFLGIVRLNMGEIMTVCARDGFLSRWYTLVGRDGKSRDKYVGGEIFLEIHIQDDLFQGSVSEKSPTDSPAEFLETALINCKINYKSLYRTLLRNCLKLDMGALGTIPEDTSDLLSDESKTTLKVWARKWLIGDAFQCIALVELLFTEYKKYNIPVKPLDTELDSLRKRINADPSWLPPYDEPALMDLLEEMFSYYHTQVTNYKEFYAKNKPDGALVSTLAMWRMVYKSNIYKSVHKGLPDSFTAYLPTVMTQAATSRYQKLLELSSPFDETNIEAVFDGLRKLTELLTEEIEIDYKYFRKPFRRDIDIVALTADVYIRSFVKSLEEKQDMIADDETVRTSSKSIFELYRKMKLMDSRYAKLMPSLRRLSNYKTFNIERWFTPFITKWLDNLSTRFEFISDLDWTDEVQYAGFMQKFARTVDLVVEQYCEGIMGESKDGESGMTWTNLLQSKQTTGPKDITIESCVKICNIEYALTKLEELYNQMNVCAQKTRVDHNKIPSSISETVKGSFKFHIAYAENMKAVTSSGLSNPYLTVQVPEGTFTDDKSTLLTGSSCELLRTKVMHDTVAPTWDETFTVLIPPVSRLIVTVYSKNMLMADEVCGRVVVDLGSRTRLRRKLEDHQSHEVFVEMEPQGRVLLRMTMEGDEDDIEFWERKTRERLMRTRGDFLKGLCSKITPYIKDVVTKSLKEHEAAPLPSTFFAAITSTIQYSTQTLSGHSITAPVTQHEADALLTPLTDHLNKNLTILYTQLSPRLCNLIIKRIWDDTLVMIETLLVPPLHGLMDRDRRVLNKRQVSMMGWVVTVLGDFFYADGVEGGLEIEMVETGRWREVRWVMGLYCEDLMALKREYEVRVGEGREREVMLRLIRLRVEKEEDLVDRDEGRKWVDEMIVKAKERR